MHQPALPPIVLAALYLNPCAGDPATFQAYVNRHVVPEVHQEVIRYYGDERGLETQYPGLDYTNARHRRRLSSFPHHRRLFRVFDQLRLSTGQIKSLCRWEGTLYSKEKFELETGTAVPCSAWPLGDFPPLKEPIAYLTPHGSSQIIPSISVASSEALPISETQRLAEEQNAMAEEHIQNELGEEEDMAEDDEVLSNASSEGDALSSSVGVELNQRLLVATAARLRGEDAVLDADWEQWLKEAVERDAGAATASAFTLYDHERRSVSPAVVDEPIWTDEIPDVFRDASSILSPAQLAAMRAMMPPPPPYPNPIQATVQMDAAAEGAASQVGTAM